VLYRPPTLLVEVLPSLLADCRRRAWSSVTVHNKRLHIFTSSLRHQLTHHKTVMYSTAYELKRNCHQIRSQYDACVANELRDLVTLTFDCLSLTL